MTERIMQLAKRVLEGDIFLPAHQSPYNHDYDDQPEPLRIAYHIRDHFRTMPIRRVEGELLTDCFRIDGFPVAGCAYRHTNHKHWSAFFHRHSDYMPNKLAMVDWNHYCSDYRIFVNKGFRCRLEDIAAARVTFAEDPDKLAFLDGMEIVLDSIRELCERYGQRVPYEPATSFAEAVQAVWFTFLLTPDSVGRLDSVLYPFYKKEKDAGTLTDALAEEYIGELLIKIFAHIGSRAHKSGDNTLVVGGWEMAEDGTLRDGFTDLSRLILKVRTELPIWRPQISFRYTAATTPETMAFVTEMNAKCSDIVFSNDEVFLQAFDRLGFERRDAVDYTKIGCNEWAIMGKSHTGSDGFFNVSAALEEVLFYEPEAAARCATFEDFYKLIRAYLDRNVQYMCDLADCFYRANAGDLNVLTSLIIDGCIQSGRSVTAGGAKYNASCWAAVGIVNLADSLSVIRQFVYEEKRLTMPQLCEILRDNWQGHEAIRAEILSRGQYFGNGIPETDELVNRLIHDLDALANTRKPGKGGRYVFGCYIGYNGAHISMGKRTRATPDGRFDGDTFTAGITAHPGQDKNGIPAFLTSAASLDYVTLCAPLAVNLRLEAGIKQKIEAVAALIHTYLSLGGLQLQPDYLSADDLRDAQAHPDCWRNLRVRITGFTGFFVQFPKADQEEVIARTEHGM